MDDITVFSILSVVIIGGACLFFALILTGIAFIFFRFFKRRKDTYQEVEGELSTNKDTYFNEVPPHLLAWDENSFADFASQLTITGRSYPGSLHYRGSIKSMTQPETFDWLAFDLQLKFGKGCMELHTAEGNYELDININNVHQMRVDGMPLGKMSLSGKRVSLFGVDGRFLGHYDHLKSGIKLVLTSVSYYRRPDYYAPLYSPLIIRDRQVAEFNPKMILTQHKELVEEPVVPLYKNIVPDMSSEEKDWTIALLGLEIWYRIGYHINKH